MSILQELIQGMLIECFTWRIVDNVREMMWVITPLKLLWLQYIFSCDLLQKSNTDSTSSHSVWVQQKSWSFLYTFICFLLFHSLLYLFSWYVFNVCQTSLGKKQPNTVVRFFDHCFLLSHHGPLLLILSYSSLLLIHCSSDLFCISYTIDKKTHYSGKFSF